MLPTYFDNDDQGPTSIRTFDNCSWHRDACRKPGCFLCGKMKTTGDRVEEERAIRKEKQKMLEEFCATIDMDRSLPLSHESNQEHRTQDVQLLYQRLIDWRTAVGACVAGAHTDGALWLQSEAGKDVVWYMNVLPVHCLELVQGHQYATDELQPMRQQRTREIVRESFRLLIQAFDELMQYKETRDLFLFSYSELQHIRTEFEKKWR